MTHAPSKLTVAGTIILLLSFDAAAQTAPNRALSVPRSTIENKPFYNPAGATPSFPAQANVPAGALNWPVTIMAIDSTCSASLAKEKELNALLEKKIALLERILASAGEPHK